VSCTYDKFMLCLDKYYKLLAILDEVIRADSFVDIRNFDRARYHIEKAEMILEIAKYEIRPEDYGEIKSALYRMREKVERGIEIELFNPINDLMRAITRKISECICEKEFK